MSSVRQRLVEVAGIQQDQGEEEQVFLKRLHQKINGVADENWGKLGDEAQKWHLAAGQAIEKSEPIPVPPGKVPTKAKTPAKKAPAKKAAPKKAPAKAAKKKTLGRPRIPDNTKIKKLVAELPEAGHRNADWDKVKDGATIKSIRTDKRLYRVCRYWRRNKFVDFVKA